MGEEAMLENPRAWVKVPDPLTMTAGYIRQPVFDAQSAVTGRAGAQVDGVSSPPCARHT